MAKKKRQPKCKTVSDYAMILRIYNQSSFIYFQLKGLQQAEIERQELMQEMAAKQIPLSQLPRIHVSRREFRAMQRKG